MVTRKAVMSATDWSLENHVARIYDHIRFRRGKPPKLFTRPEEDRPAVQQSLMDWNADLGARHRMDWAGFLKHHQAILRRLSSLPRLGKLSDDEVGKVCSVVSDLERFKRTAGKSLVFGSKAAHFHFPWLVPVISSEVVEGLKALQRGHADELVQLLRPSTSSWFSFSTPASSLSSYRNYVSLGNKMMRDVDTRWLLGRRSPKYGLHAKVFEWWVIAFRN